MAVTRINNNQISDASAGNAYVGINAAVKLQNYSVTAGKLANNITYASDLTITGNLTIQGNTTTVDTTYTTIEDPTILLASNQTGSPTVDIGFVGERGTANNIAFVWDESASEFVTVYTSSAESNTTITITSYADLHTANANIGGNIVINGNASVVGTVVGNVSLAGNITMGNVLTNGQVSAAGNVTGGNVNTGGQVVATANITGGNLLTSGIVSAASHIGSVVSVTGNITGGNVNTGGLVSATGNITSAANVSGGNVLSSALVQGVTLSASGNVIGGNVTTAGLISATGNITSAANVAGGNLLATTTVSAASHIGTTASLSGNVTGGNLLTGGLISATSTITSAANISGANLVASSNVFAVGGYFTGNVTVLGNLNATIGIVYANSGVFYGATPTGNGAIYAGITGYTPLGSNVVAQFAGNANSYSQINFQNISNLSSASTDYIATADNGSDTTYYLDMGINSSNFNDQVNYPGFGPNDSYVHNHGGNLILNPESSGKVIKFMVGGTGNAQVVANVTSTGITSGGTFSAAGNITSASNIAGGNLLATTTVSAASHIGTIASLSGNVTGGNIITGGAVLATGNVSATANVLGGNLVATTAVVTPTVIGTTVTISSTGGLITLAPSSNVSVNNKNINNLAQPVQDNDAASKIYVDNMTSTALAYHTAVAAATTTTLEVATGGTITYAQPNGAGNGVGATLTVAGGTFNLIDTANIQTANTRVLVKNQANTALNGIYQWSNATVLVRTTDADTYGPNSSTDLSINDYFFVTGGLTNEGSAWVVDAPSGTITFGTSGITFAQFSSSQVYEANTSAGLSLTGTTFSAKVDNNTTAFDGGGNIIVKASANLTTPNIGAATGTSLSVTGNLTGAGANVSGNVTGGNILTAGIVSAASHIGSVVSVTGNVTGGNLLTGGLISSTGNITSAANVAGGNLLATTTVSAASHIGTTASLSGNVTGGNLLTGGLISATSTITSAANITGGNLLTSGIVSAASHIGSVVSVTGNVTAAGITSSANMSAAGNITASYYFGNGSQLTGVAASTSGFPVSAGTSNIAAATNGNVGVSIAATSNVLTIASTGIFTTGLSSVTGNITGGNLLTGGQLVSTLAGNSTTGAGQIFLNGASNNRIDWAAVGTGAPAFTTRSAGTKVALYPAISGSTVDYAIGIDAATMWYSVPENGASFKFKWYGATTEVANLSGTGAFTAAGNITGGNLLTAGLISATGNITGGNILGGSGIITTTGNITGANINTGGTGGLTLTGANINSNASRITINQTDSDVDFAVDGLSQGNIFYVDAGTKTASFGNSTQTTNSIVAFNASTSVLMPVGNTAQRPGTGVTGMMRFNSTTNAVEIYDNSTWATVGTPSFTIVADDQFTGNGVQTAFTLSASSYTTNSVIVSINGVVQIPTTAYSVTGATLTFTEAPQTGDLIDVRELVTTTQVTSIANSPGNAVVAVNPTINEVSITGNLVPVANGIQSLGTSSLRWKDLFVSGNTITMGNVVMKNVAGGNTIGFYGPDGTTPATIASTSVDTTTIANGTSSVTVTASAGNIAVTVGGTSIVAFTSAGIINSGSNGTGNIGNSTGYFNTVFAKATSAQYADLAENYVADAEYSPGTVLSFGGAHEVTLTTEAGDKRIAGVVSTNPSYIMNSTVEGEFIATVALTGRVPTFVSGPVEKGDMMVSGGNGRAVACASPVIGTVIGKALENHAGGEGVIEVVVGRL